MAHRRHSWTLLACLVACQAIGQEPSQKGGVDADLAKPVATFTGHVSPIATLAFNADGTRIVSACAKDLRTWDVASGKEIAVLKGSGGTVVALSPDGKTLAVAIRTGRGAALDSLTLLDAETGKERFTAESYPDWDKTTVYRPAINALAFSPDSKQVATAGSMGGRWIAQGVVAVWDVKSGKAVHRFDKLSTSACAVSFSPNGQSVAAATIGIGGELPRGGEVWVWELEKGKALHTLQPKKPDYGEFVSATDVAFSPDGKRVAASVSGDSRGQPAGLIVPEGPVFIKIWELASGKELLTLSGHSKEIGRIAFSPDGKRLASAGTDGTVRLWNTTTGKTVATYPFEVGQIGVVGFSPDGRRLAAAGSNPNKPGEIRVWACPRE